MAREFDRRRVVAIFKAKGNQKAIAKYYGVTQGHVSRIKNGQRNTAITALLRNPAIMALNGTLITLACGVRP
jgi:hypothetical protein